MPFFYSFFHSALQGAVHLRIMIPDRFLTGFILKLCLFVCAEFLEFSVSFFDIFVFLCHGFKLPSGLPSEETHPVEDIWIVFQFFRQFFEFEDLYFHQIGILFAGFFIAEADRAVTVVILFKVNEIQDAHMDAFFEIFIRFAFFQLVRKNFAQVEQDPGVPVFEVCHLHFHIKLLSVFQ